MPESSLTITTSDPTGVISVTPEVAPDGKPVVIVTIKKAGPGVHLDALVDGQAAIGFVLSILPDGPRENNAAWELAHLLTQKWAEAEKLAESRKQTP